MSDILTKHIFNMEEGGKVLLFIGSQGKGKSNAVRWLLLRNLVSKNPVYEFGIVFTKTKFDDEYDFLPDEAIIHGYEEEVLSEYVKTLQEHIEKNGKPAPRNFIVFDDLIGLLSKHDPFLINLFGTIRHFNADIYLTSQHLNTGSSTLLRNITTHGILFNSKQFNTLKSLYENYGMLFEKFDDFKDHFLKVTSEKFVGMLYLQDKDDREENYLYFKAPDVSKVKAKVKF